MSHLSDEPTAPFGPVPGGPGVQMDPVPPDRPQRRRHPGVGAHRRDPTGPDDDRRWPWLVALGVLGVVGVLGMIWLLAGIPDPNALRRVVSPPSQGSQSSPTDDTSSTEPSQTAIDSSTPTGTPSGTPTRSPTSTPASTSAAAPSATATRTRPPAPTLIPVPDVVGKRQTPATTMLRNAGFAVAVVHTTTPERRQANRVISQSPAGGQQARSGSTVTIVVNVAGPA